jgi:hypothetical protein
MEASRELAYIIRNVEKEKLKYALVVLKDVKKKISDKVALMSIENEMNKIEDQLASVIADLEDRDIDDIE